MPRDLVARADGRIAHRGNGKRFEGVNLPDLDPGDRIEFPDGRRMTLISKRVDPLSGFTIVDVQHEGGEERDRPARD